MSNTAAFHSSVTVPVGSFRNADRRPWNSNHEPAFSEVKPITDNIKFRRNAAADDGVFVHFRFETLTEMLEKSCEYHGDNQMFGTKNGAGFDWMTYKEFSKIVARTRNVLTRLGVKKNVKVAIISNNRWEWAAINYATMTLGGQIVPMYEAQFEEDWKYVIEDSESKILVVAAEKIYQIVKDYPGKVGKIEQVICLDATEEKSYSYKG
jgi:long-subunit acyl-CoA synthetase (AMP-forming)